MDLKYVRSAFFCFPGLVAYYICTFIWLAALTANQPSMRLSTLKRFLTCSFSILNCFISIAQIVDFTRENPYKKVFVDTDNFGVSYLQVLADSYPMATPDSLQFLMLNDLAYYWHTRNLTSALKFTREGLSRTVKANDSIWQGRFQVTLGAIYLRMEKLDSAEVVLEDAKVKVLKKDLPFLHTQLGYVFERRGELDKAADHILTSLHLGQQLQDNKAIALAYSDLSNLFWKQAKFEKGLEFGLKSLRIFEERGINDLDYDFTLYVVGNNYLDLKNYEEAETYFQHALAIGERYGFYNNLSDVYISMVELMAHLNRLDEAEIAGQNALKYARLLDNSFMTMRSWLALGKLQNLQGKYESAIESLQNCIEVATELFGDEYYLSQAYEALGKAYAGNHSYQEAYQAMAKYDQLKNQIFTAEADQRISMLQTELDLDQKENTIQLQIGQISRQRTTQILTVSLVCLLVLYLVLLVKAYRNNIRKNKLLEKQNEEKAYLLKEIHHRVKNNLEIVSGLLSLQSAQINDPNITEAIQKSQQRVQSMSMIHQKLYQGKSLANIEMKDYFLNLGTFLIHAYGAEDQIEFECEMVPLDLDVDMAIPIGLIVNELLTNAMKYAFPDARRGIISIDLRKSGTLLHLTVSDNGIGKLPENMIHGTGFGTQLIQLLTQQLDGKMELSVFNGTSVTIQFQHTKAA